MLRSCRPGSRSPDRLRMFRYRCVPESGSGNGVCRDCPKEDAAETDLQEGADPVYCRSLVRATSFFAVGRFGCRRMFGRDGRPGRRTDSPCPDVRRLAYDRRGGPYSCLAAGRIGSWGGKSEKTHEPLRSGEPDDRMDKRGCLTSCFNPLRIAYSEKIPE